MKTGFILFAAVIFSLNSFSQKVDTVLNYEYREKDNDVFFLRLINDSFNFGACNKSDNIYLVFTGRYKIVNNKIRLLPDDSSKWYLDYCLKDTNYYPVAQNLIAGKPIPFINNIIFPEGINGKTATTEGKYRHYTGIFLGGNLIEIKTKNCFESISWSCTRTYKDSGTFFNTGLHSYKFLSSNKKPYLQYIIDDNQFYLFPGYIICSRIEETSHEVYGKTISLNFRYFKKTE